MITDAQFELARKAYNESWYANPSVDKALRAALAAAQAAGATTLPLTPAGEAVAAEIGRTIQWQQGFAAGIEAVAQVADEERAACEASAQDDEVGTHILAGQVGASSRIAAAIRALRPPAAPAESEVMQHSFGTLDKTPPLSASEPAGAWLPHFDFHDEKRWPPQGHPLYSMFHAYPVNAHSD
jgi:hypothetical protein